jgi:hypothetical protein
MMPGRGLLQVTPETVIKSLDPGFFTPEFDPILYYLVRVIETRLRL